ncbi:MAG: hypothetical protein ACK5TO_12955, partial [Planctomycetaceae bacterium]
SLRQWMPSAEAKLSSPLLVMVPPTALYFSSGRAWGLVSRNGAKLCVSSPPRQNILFCLLPVLFCVGGQSKSP